MRFYKNIFENLNKNNWMRVGSKIVVKYNKINYLRLKQTFKYNFSNLKRKKNDEIKIKYRYYRN